MRTFLLSLGLVLSAGALPLSAQAGNCVGTWTGFCDVGGGDTCQLVGTEIVCDLTRVADTHDTDVSAVYDPSGALCGADYCINGVEASGAGFCCAEAAGTTTELRVEGGSHVDRVNLGATVGATTYQLAEHGTSPFRGVVQGNDGDDIIVGSDHASPDYTDLLFGGRHRDTIDGMGGDDDIAGGPQGDFLYGGPGYDILKGDSGHDELYGGTQGDELYGGPGRDLLWGEAGHDTLRGDDDVDILCGHAGRDTLDGGNHDDVLWSGGSLGDSNDGAPGLDGCDAVPSVNCESVLTVSPPECL